MAERGVIEALAFPSHQMQVSDIGTHKYPVKFPFQSKQFEGLRIGVISCNWSQKVAECPTGRSHGLVIREEM